MNPTGIPSLGDTVITHHAPVNTRISPHSRKAQGRQAINSNPHFKRAFTLYDTENGNVTESGL